MGLGEGGESIGGSLGEIDGRPVDDMVSGEQSGHGVLGVHFSPAPV
jgi:hypothetical protein